MRVVIVIVAVAVVAGAADAASQMLAGPHSFEENDAQEADSSRQPGR